MLGAYDHKDEERARKTSQEVPPGKKLHVCAIPLHLVFQEVNKNFFNKADRAYIISAHVEPSESSGAKGFFRHLGANYSNVANYEAGMEIGKSKIEEGPPTLSQLNDLGSSSRDEVGRFIFERDSYSMGSVLGYMFQALERIRYGSVISFISAFLMSIVGVAFLLGWIGLFNFLNTDYMFGSSFNFVTNAIAGVLFPIWGVFNIYLGCRKLPETELSGLIDIIMGLGFVFPGLIVLYGTFQSFSSPALVLLYRASSILLMLTWVFWIGILNPRLRFFSMAITVMLAASLLIIWVPDFFGLLEIRLFFALGFGILLSLMIGFAYNFMKSVELILEMNNSFGLIIDLDGTSRAKLKQEIQKALKSKEEEEKVKKRIFGVFSTFIGFRPQGTIEFTHIPMDQKDVGDQQRIQSKIYPIVGSTFDGQSLKIKIRTQENAEVKLQFDRFSPGVGAKYVEPIKMFR